MKKEIFGTAPSGEAVELYTLENESATLKIMTWGATVVSFAPFGQQIVGGFDTFEDYLLDTWHQGALIGRVANRIGGACFEMDGVTYHVPKNNGENCLHGGNGFDRRLFKCVDISENSITLEYRSHDGEEGFPSSVLIRIVYKLEGSALLMDYFATPDGKTPIALTNHAYFNLDGFGGTVLDHVLTVDADRYTKTDEALIPTGERPLVEGTALDFRTPHTIGERLAEAAPGYDHNFILNGKHTRELFGYTLPFAAKAEGRELSLSVYTDQPGVQLYVAEFNENLPNFRGDVPKILWGAFCLETQTEPNCIKNGIGFYEKGEVYRHRTVYLVEKR